LKSFSFNSALWGWKAQIFFLKRTVAYFKNGFDAILHLGWAVFIEQNRALAWVNQLPALMILA
jgi:hypothetical protein